MTASVNPSPLRPGSNLDAPSPTPLALAGKRVHFVGVGGSGMSGLARIALRAGALCTGSDQAPSAAIESLRADGVPVVLEQATASVPAECDMLVISAAIRSDHPEVVEARRRGVTVLKYAQMLGRLMIGRRGVAIAGTHGKSTTTSLLAHVLIQAELDPSFIVGAHCAQIGGGARTGASDLLIAEACEFDRSFHNFHPTHAAILNVEEDHLDVYKNIDEIVESFRVFAQKLPPRSPGGAGAAPVGGYLLINHEMPHRLAITAGLGCAIETIGFAPQADWRVEVERATREPTSPLLVHLYHNENHMASWKSPLPGEHMAYNAAVAAVLAHRVGAGWPTIVAAVESFAGLDRRMQLLGYRHVDGPWGEGDITVVDDYGHHPTEVDTTLRALRRRYSPNRLICVFQPHQHSRTRFLMEQFAASFDTADVVVVPHIYFVRDSEAERHAVSAADLVDRLRKRGSPTKQAMHLYPFAAIVEQLELIARPGDLLVTMGAGDVWKIGRDFLDPDAPRLT